MATANFGNILRNSGNVYYSLLLRPIKSHLLKRHLNTHHPTQSIRNGLCTQIPTLPRLVCSRASFMSEVWLPYTEMHF